MNLLNGRCACQLAQTPVTCGAIDHPGGAGGSDPKPVRPRARKWSRKIFAVFQTVPRKSPFLMKGKSDLLVQLGVAVVVMGLLLVVLHWY